MSHLSFFKNIRRAWRGVTLTLHEEKSFRLQMFVGVLAASLAVWLPLARYERILIFLLILMVLILELLNSILERLADAMAPRLSYLVKDVKDMMAGVVLLASFGAAVVGLFIFLPPLWQMWCVTIPACMTLF